MEKRAVLEEPPSSACLKEVTSLRCGFDKKQTNKQTNIKKQRQQAFPESSLSLP